MVADWLSTTQCLSPTKRAGAQSIDSNRGSTQFVDGVHQNLDILGINPWRNAVTQVKDMAGAASIIFENVPNG